MKKTIHGVPLAKLADSELEFAEMITKSYLNASPENCYQFIDATDNYDDSDESLVAAFGDNNIDEFIKECKPLAVYSLSENKHVRVYETTNGTKFVHMAYVDDFGTFECILATTDTLIA